MVYERSLASNCLVREGWELHSARRDNTRPRGEGGGAGNFSQELYTQPDGSRDGDGSCEVPKPLHDGGAACCSHRCVAAPQVLIFPTASAEMKDLGRACTPKDHDDAPYRGVGAAVNCYPGCEGCVVDRHDVPFGVGLMFR